MENPVALVKPKLSPSETKIINLVIDGLPSENSRRAYQRALEEFFYWHQEQNRPELNKALIQKYVKSLRAQKLSSAALASKLFLADSITEAENFVYAETWLSGDGLSSNVKIWEDSIYLPGYNAVLTIFNRLIE